MPFVAMSVTLMTCHAAAASTPANGTTATTSANVRSVRSAAAEGIFVEGSLLVGSAGTSVSIVVSMTGGP